MGNQLVREEVDEANFGLSKSDGTHLTLVVRPVGSLCNASCEYCYYRKDDQVSPRRMPSEVLFEVTRQTLDYARAYCGFIWHGGEPLLAGKDFFESALALQARFYGEGQVVENMIQTNGTLIDDEWASFFRSREFHVGVSLDGPQPIHDLHRRDRRGNRTFARVDRGLQTLGRHCVECGVIAVVTKNSIGTLPTTFTYLVGRGIKRISFNLCVEMQLTGHRRQLERFSLTPADYVETLCRVFDLWLAAGDPELVVRDVEEILTSAFGKRITSCRYGTTCTDFVTVEYNGDIFGCECFLPNVDAWLGNILETPLADILNGSRHIEFARKYYRLFEECAGCDYYPICRGGCAYERWFWDHQFRDRTAYCWIRQRYFDYVLERLTQIRQGLYERSGGAPKGSPGSARESGAHQSSD